MTAIALSSPVGKTTGNKRLEVRAVQQALNRHMKCKIGYIPIKEDGCIGLETFNAIRAFQQMSGVLSPDAIVVPGGPTHKALNQPFIRILNPTAACLVADQAKVRAIIIDRLGIVERSGWNALNPATLPPNDWNYHSIAIHHAGNSFSCSAVSIDSIRQVEKIDMAKFGQVSYHYAIDCKGAIYEALDIRDKGSHVESMNTGVVGIVYLADLSVRGEAAQHGPGVLNAARAKGREQAAGELLSVLADRLDFRNDEGNERQLAAGASLVSTLREFFPIKKLGGHREFAKAIGSNRPCPGVYGMIIAEQLRSRFGLAQP